MATNRDNVQLSNGATDENQSDIGGIGGTSEPTPGGTGSGSGIGTGSGTGSGTANPGNSGTATAPIRARKPRAKKEEGSAEENIQMGQTPVTLPDDPPKRERKPRTVKATADPTESKEAAQGLIFMVQTFAIARFGVGAQFTPMEIELIQPSLTRIIERYGSAMEKFSVFVDPAMLAIGIVMYSSRLTALARETKPQPQPQQPAETMSANGNNPDVVPSASPDIANIIGGIWQQ